MSYNAEAERKEGSEIEIDLGKTLRADIQEDPIQAEITTLTA